MSPIPPVNNGVLEPARELAAPAGGPSQYLHPRRHRFAHSLGGGFSLLERGRILKVYLFVSDAFLRLQP